VFFKRGAARYYLKDYTNAAVDLDKAINGGIKDAIAFDMRGYCRYENKNFDAAIKDFDEAVAKDPKLALAFYHRGRCEVRRKQFAGCSAGLFTGHYTWTYRPCSL
jgi:tetratricopeptide (TPR) repeat protein